MLKKHISFFFILIIFQNQSSAADQNFLYPTLNMHGEIYQNSCSPAERSDLMNNFRQNDVPEQKSLKTTLETILCADKNKENSKRILEILDYKIMESYEGTGEQEYKSVTPKRKEFVTQIMAERNAWRARVVGNRDEITFQYFSNEACVNSVSLRYTKQKWLIYKIGGACD